MEADAHIKLSVEQITEQQAKIAQIIYDKATETKLLAKNHAETVVDLGSTRDFMKRGEIDHAFQNAFEQDDYRAVLQCWNAMKRFDVAPPVALANVLQSMQRFK